jgi:O-acetyl-ADP-ribose deacetylase (regulator of RNase III)
VRVQIEVIQADITNLRVSAIVNAANSDLAGGGGVDGAIHRAAGPKLMLACRQIGGCPTGEARITPAFDLPASFVIHAVGPVWQGGNRGEPELLRRCYRSAMALAISHACESLALSAISCGVYGYPVDGAAEIAVDEILATPVPGGLPSRVIFVCYSQTVLEAYSRALARRPVGQPPAAN